MPGGKNNIRHEDGKPFSKENQPKNRRKSTKFLTEMLTKELKKKKEVKVEGIDASGNKVTVTIPVPNREILIQALLRQAAKGNVTAIKEVLDRVEGKVVEKVEVSTPKVGLDAAEEETYE